MNKTYKNNWEKAWRRKMNNHERIRKQLQDASMEKMREFVLHDCDEWGCKEPTR